MAPGPSAPKYLQRTASQPPWLQSEQEQLLFANSYWKASKFQENIRPARYITTALLLKTGHSNTMASILTIGVGVAAAAFLVRLHPIYSINDTDSLAG
jgi:hypothetical protein